MIVILHKVHLLINKPLKQVLQKQNHKILKPAISEFYIRFHPVLSALFSLHTKTYATILMTAKVAR